MNDDVKAKSPRFALFGAAALVVAVGIGAGLYKDRATLFEGDFTREEMAYGLACVKRLPGVLCATDRYHDGGDNG